MVTPRVHIHVTRWVCEYPGCSLSGFHFHWRRRVHRSAHDGSLTPLEEEEFEADCVLDNADRRRARGERG